MSTLSLQEIFSQVESVPDYYGHSITSVHYKNGWGDTPLHIVSCWGDCEAIRVLVAAGADINARGETAFTPLHCATEQNRLEAVVLLLSLGAEIVRDANGHTPVDLAELLEREEIFRILQEGI
jgi:ankyrin repeat protein